MKKGKQGLILIILFLFQYSSTYSQVDSNKCNSILDTLTKIEVYTKVDKMPEVIGGDELLLEEIHNNIKYNLDCDDYNGSKVVVGFIINVDGRLIGKRIIREPSSCAEFGKQILSIIDNVKWNPGTCNGKNVPVIFAMPIFIDVK